MAPSSPNPPDVLVLGGGGILGEAWLSAVLSGLHDAGGFDARECGAFVGTSAGSIVAAALAAGVDPRTRLGKLPEPPPVTDGAASRSDSGFAGRALRLGGAAAGVAAAPLASIALRTSTGGGALVRRAALGRVPAGQRSLRGLGETIDRMGGGWDGRLHIAVVEVDSGRRVVLDGAEKFAPSVGQAVEASCAIPGVFRPVKIGERTYVDGGAWSPTNLDAAPAGPGDRVLCLNPTGSLLTGMGLPIGAFGPMSRSMASVEALALRGRRARVTVVSPDAACAEAMGANLMDARPRAAVIAAGVEQGRRMARARQRHGQRATG